MRLKHILLMAGLIAGTALSADAERLVLLHTNDTHSHIDPDPDGLGGVARRKVVIDSVRNANANVLLIDAGDVVQGSLFFNIYKGEVEEKVMNALGYDMRILGNHEFDNGIEALAENLKNSQAVLLGANYQMRGTPLEPLFKPYEVRDIDGKRIAFMPVNLEPKGMIADGNYDGLGYIDAIEAANNEAWFLKNILQADIVVALTHIGYQENDKPCDVDLAKASHDIDVIIGGHSHTTLNPDDPKSKPHIIKNADGRDVLVTQTGRYGKYLGEITIDLDSITATPQYRLISIDSRLDDRIDPEIDVIIEPYRAAVNDLNNSVIAKTARALERTEPSLLNYCSDFVADRGRQLVPDIDMAILNAGGLRIDLPKGNISEGQIITLMPFFNRIVVLEISGEDLLKTFDVMARAGGNGISSEATAIFDPESGKCTEVKIGGKNLDTNKTYRIATIDYLANGGDYMEPLTHASVIKRSDNILFEDLIEYLKYGKGKGKTINPSPKPRMQAVNNK